MNRNHPKLRSAGRVSAACLLLPVCLGLGACATWQDYLDARTKRAPPTPSTPLAERARVEPMEANVFVLEDEAQSVIGEPQLVFSRASDNLSLIAREYGLGFDELVAANPAVDPWLPGEGTPVMLPTQFVLPDAPREGIVLNIANKRLFYYPPAEAGEQQVVMTYPIGIGRVGWETPLGSAEVVSKARDPHWWVPASVRKEHAELGDPLPAVVPPGPDNPLGKYVLKLDMPGYLIHGTNQPYGVGMRVSHGCVRLYPENIEVLFPLISIGAGVTIVNQPYLTGWWGDELYFEAHGPLEDDTVAPEEHFTAAFSGVSGKLGDAALEVARLNAATIASVASGLPVRVLLNDLDEVYERARVVRNIVEPDPDVPTLAEVRELLDTPLDDPEAAEEPVEEDASSE